MTTRDPRRDAPRDGGPDLRTASEQAAAGQSAYDRPPSSTDPGAYEVAGEDARRTPPEEDEQRRQPSSP